MLRNDDIYEEIIRNHVLYSNNYLIDLDNVNYSAHGTNLVCGDDITVDIYNKNSVIRDISFQGNCCSIAKSSASLMTEELKGKTIDEAKELFSKVNETITTENYCGSLFQVLIKQISSMPSEKKHHQTAKCALFPWEVMLKAILDEDYASNTRRKKDYSLFLE